MGLVQIGGEIRAKPLNDNFQYLDGKLLFGPESNRPNPGVANRLYVTIDTGIVYADTGTEWKQVGGISQINWSNIIGKPSTFPPSAHASQHRSGGSDPITPADIGAAPSNHTHSGNNITSPVQSAFKIVSETTYRISSNTPPNDPLLSGSRISVDFVDDFTAGGSQYKTIVTIRGLIVNGAIQLALPYNDGNTGEHVYIRFQHFSDATWGPWYKLWHGGNAGPFYRGAGSPEGVVTAPPGSIYQNTNGGQGTTVYYKASGTGNTGWRAIA